MKAKKKNVGLKMPSEKEIETLFNGMDIGEEGENLPRSSPVCDTCNRENRYLVTQKVYRPLFRTDAGAYFPASTEWHPAKEYFQHAISYHGWEFKYIEVYSDMIPKGP
jgi:hypothetical protein